MKKCPKCKEIKDLIHFYKNRRRKNGVGTYCKPCQLIISRPSAYLYSKRYNQTEHGKQLHRESSRRYKLRNPGKYNEYDKKRKQIDPSFKMAKNLRSRLSMAIKNNKAGSAIKDLGCTVEQLKKYIEFKFQPGMTWDNYGRNGWHIDHIKPLSSFDLNDREQFLQACHFTNLQPLWAEDNLRKQDKIILT